jgi:multidrug efflux pump subunit AcrA (membrane-fusion protein)
VNLDAAESDLGHIVIGQSANITFAALPGRHYDARVREISPAADPQSRTYRVKLTLTQAGSEVHLGMTGDAILAASGAANPRAGGTAAASGGSADTASTSNATFSVPATAIFHQGRNPAVWVIRPDDSKLELRPVTVSRYGERSVTVTSGLKNDEQIVLAGVHTVYAGQHVKPVRPLFDGDGDIDGPAASGAGNAPNTPNTPNTPNGSNGSNGSNVSDASNAPGSGAAQ